MIGSRLYLPSEIKLTCAGCGKSFSVSLRSLDGKESLMCAFCGAEMNVIESMPHFVRKQIYRAAREKVEEELVIKLDMMGRFLK